MSAKKGCSTNFIVYDGIRFYKTAQGYWCSGKSKRLHVYVWEQFHGKVPDGYDIHHEDGNKDNNDIHNLICVNREDHHKYHAMMMTDEQKQGRIDRLEKFARPKATEWHKSEEGRSWHKKHYDETMADKWDEKSELVCEVCGKKYVVPALVAYHSRFCSNNCRSAYRRRSGVDNIDIPCQICGKKFSTNKYARAKYCSNECRETAKLRRKAEV